MQAMGRYLLLIVEGGKYQAEGFRACQELQAASEFAVLTGHHLLCVTSPGLRFLPLLKWQVALEGVILVQRYASCPCACSAPAISSRCSQGPDAELTVCHGSRAGSTQVPPVLRSLQLPSLLWLQLTQLMLAGRRRSWSCWCWHPG